MAKVALDLRAWVTAYVHRHIPVYTLGFQKHKKGKFFAIMAEVWN